MSNKPDNAHWLQETLEHMAYMKNELTLEINRMSKLGEPVYGYFNANAWTEALNKWIGTIAIAERYSISQHEAASLVTRLLEKRQQLEKVKKAGVKTDAFLSVINSLEIERWLLNLRSIIAKLESRR